jgi:hypothetical protein
MEIIEIKTLVDITNTDVRRVNQGTQLQFFQFRNWTTLLQCISLRANIEYEYDPYFKELDITGMGFGKNYSGIHKIWTFSSTSAQSDTFFNLNDQTFLLREDLVNVPIIINLTETINIKNALFDLDSADFCNTIVKAF